MYHPEGVYVYRKNPEGVWEWWHSWNGGWVVSLYQGNKFLPGSVILSYDATWAEPYYEDI